jgi:hypothetical protein
LRYAVQCGYRHGQKSALQNAVLHVMCRRRDLPQLPPAPKRTAVRLFRSHIDGVVIAEYTDPGDDWQEIKVDPQTGELYVEEE